MCIRSNNCICSYCGAKGFELKAHFNANLRYSASTILLYYVSKHKYKVLWFEAIAKSFEEENELEA